MVDEQERRSGESIKYLLTTEEGPCYADAALVVTLVTFVAGQVATATTGSSSSSSSSSAASCEHAAMMCISSPAGRIVLSPPM